MYSDWANLQLDIDFETNKPGVLNKFPLAVSKDVTSAVVRSLAHNLSITISNNEPSKLTTDHDVKWTMEVNLDDSLC